MREALSSTLSGQDGKVTGDGENGQTEPTAVQIGKKKNA